MFALSTLLLVSSVLAAPLPWKREVPQEHSHEATLRAVRETLNLNNPDKILDPVFALLGNAAANNGKGNIADPDCLQQAVADQAFTNAKAAGDINGMVNALIFRALERNTGAVGQKSNLCTSIAAKNPEIAAIQQHQDPASDGAAATNKAITLELAKQIKSVGGDPLDAIQSGTFAPGQIGDPTGKGNTCDDENDAQGCIFTLNLFVPDVTEAEVLAAVGGAGDGNGNEAATTTEAAATTTEAAATTTAAADATATECAATVTVTVTETPAATATDCPETITVTTTAAGTATETTAAPAETTTAAAGGNGANLQSFTGALGGISAPAVTEGGRNFQVENNADFLNLNAALNRSCDVQKNQCANAANADRNAGFSVADCETQATECRALIQ